MAGWFVKGGAALLAVGLVLALSGINLPELDAAQKVCETVDQIIKVLSEFR